MLKPPFIGRGIFFSFSLPGLPPPLTFIWTPFRASQNNPFQHISVFSRMQETPSILLSPFPFVSKDDPLPLSSCSPVFFLQVSLVFSALEDLFFLLFRLLFLFAPDGRPSWWTGSCVSPRPLFPLRHGARCLGSFD